MPGNAKPKLLFLVSDARYFCSHRINLAKAAANRGFEVAVATRCTEENIVNKIKDTGKDKDKDKDKEYDNYQRIIQEKGIHVFPLHYFNRSGINPFRQLLTLYELYKIYQSFNPDIVHHVAIKPVLFGSLVAKLCRVPKVINALGGLGYLFTDQSADRQIKYFLNNFKKRILLLSIKRLYKWAFSQPNTVLILQNNDDLETLINYGCISEHIKDNARHNSIDHSDKKVVIIPGSGIDTQSFLVTAPPSPPHIVITCISRMLWDKGIGELVDAARIIQKQYKKINIKIILYGSPDLENPASISLDTLEQWNASGIVEWKGYCKDVAKAYAECHIAVLPSYREGLPKSLLEAASCGKPIVTTDVPGCREVVKHGDNGFLVPAQNPEALAERLLELVQNEALRISMGERGRQRMEEFFSEAVVHEKILELYTAS